MILGKLVEPVENANVSVIRQHGRVLREQRDGHKPLVVFRQPFQYEERVALAGTTTRRGRNEVAGP